MCGRENEKCTFPSPAQTLYRLDSYENVSSKYHWQMISLTDDRLFIGIYIMCTFSFRQCPMWCGEPPEDARLPIISNKTISIFPKILQRTEYFLQLSQHFSFSTVSLGQDLFGYSQWNCWLRPQHLGSPMTSFFSSYSHFSSHHYLGWREVHRL